MFRDMATPRWDWFLPILFDNFIRHEVVGQIRGASCLTMARVPLEHELSIETNLAATEHGLAHRSLKAASQTSRPQRRRRRAPDGYITVSQLAERADAALSSAYSWVETGKLAASRWRNIIIVNERDVADFLSVKPLRPADANAQEARHG
jgi:hypothetical protein